MMNFLHIHPGIWCPAVHFKDTCNRHSYKQNYIRFHLFFYCCYEIREGFLNCFSQKMLNSPYKQISLTSIFTAVTKTCRLWIIVQIPIFTLSNNGFLKLVTLFESCFQCIKCELLVLTIPDWCHCEMCVFKLKNRRHTATEPIKEWPVSVLTSKGSHGSLRNLSSLNAGDFMKSQHGQPYFPCFL